jgi:acetyl-CoA C-acetyltransferase
MDAFVFEALRTPRGAAKDTGALRGVRPVELVAQLLSALRERAGLDPARVDDLILGCATQVGDQGACIAKAALLWAGWPHAVAGATVNRLCTSGLEAIAMAAGKVSSGQADLVIAGGVESMSRVPMMADKGAWFADPDVARATRFVHMGVAADAVATLDGRSREDLDRVAMRSHERAARATDEALFARSLVPVRDADGKVLLDRDETIRPGLTLDKLGKLAPAFAEMNGKDVVKAVHPEIATLRHVHTVGTSPAMTDGASVVVVGTREAGKALGLVPRARIASYAAIGSDPVTMLTAPAPATTKALAKAGRSISDVALFECNESFAATLLRFERTLDVDPERVNPLGGAIAMGHPLGATGGILVATLLDELERREHELGVVAMCAGMGLGAAMVLERT